MPISEYSLFKARVAWSYLLDFDDAASFDWRTWAEDEIRKVDFIAPFWLCELTVAPNAKAALDCVRDGIGDEYGVYPEGDIDHWSLLFGLLYLKFARHPEWALEAWRVMADFGDIHEYVDAGHWRKYQGNRDIDSFGAIFEMMFDKTFEERTSMIFRPVSAYALQTVRSTFKSSPHVKRVFLKWSKDSK
jgi:hypothetical protein